MPFLKTFSLANIWIMLFLYILNSYQLWDLGLKLNATILATTIQLEIIWNSINDLLLVNFFSLPSPLPLSQIEFSTFFCFFWEGGINNSSFSQQFRASNIAFTIFDANQHPHLWLLKLVVVETWNIYLIVWLSQQRFLHMEVVGNVLLLLFSRSQKFGAHVGWGARGVPMWL
jgi:hypothetical protein